MRFKIFEEGMSFSAHFAFAHHNKNHIFLSHS
jgi:hypothetical protein